MHEKIEASQLAAACISRRSFFSSAGVATGGVVAASIFPDLAHANEGESARAGSLCEAPLPIPHVGATPFGVSLHGFFPGPVEGTATPTDPTGAHPAGRDPSEIFDFRGFIGQADLNLTGSGTDLNSHETAPYAFHADMRFMKGVFVGTDGRRHRGAFAFI
jgi:hypothetical protein